MGKTPMGPPQIAAILEGLEKEWPARSYQILSRNCTDFAEAFAKELHVPMPFPRWVHGLAKIILQRTSPINSVRRPLPSCDDAFACCSSCGFKRFDVENAPQKDVAD